MSTTRTESPVRPPARTYSRWASLIVLCAGALMTILDGSIVTVAMPAIQNDLGFSRAGLAWVVNAYLIPFGGLLLLVGRLGDLQLATGTVCRLGTEHGRPVIAGWNVRPPS